MHRAQSTLNIGGRIIGPLGTKSVHLGDAPEQYKLGFDIESITSLDETVSTIDLQPFDSVKRLTNAAPSDGRP